MKLTKIQRDAFVRAVMDDVPTIDYVAQGAKILQDFQVRHMPKEIQAIYKNPELRGFLKVNYNGYYFTQSGNISCYGDAALDDATRGKLKELNEANAAQHWKRRDLRVKLENAVAHVTTRKALVEALPEFEKYAPADGEPLSRSVPALANVVSDFVKAGWPKDKPKLAAKAPAKRGRKAASK